jgi:4-alpha-glucanotransferase
MLRHGLGRFCVTQKADPHNPDDVYRGENTAPNDWIMVGTHDTHPLATVIGTWSARRRADRAALLARNLSPDPAKRERLRRLYAADSGTFTQAMFTELFLAPARNVSVFFADLFGMRQTYNQPGTVGAHNWTLRVPPDYRRRYADGCEGKTAFDVAACLAAALRIRAGEVAEGDVTALARRLEDQ